MFDEDVRDWPSQPKQEPATPREDSLAGMFKQLSDEATIRARAREAAEKARLAASNRRPGLSDGK